MNADATEGAGDVTPLNQLFGLCSTGNQDTEFLPERRSLRIHGHSTTIRLERAFWNVLEELAASESVTVASIVTKIYDHCQVANQKNLASCLRVVCLKFINIGL
ncbi:MAG: ribbon-helix-helix domain-containing protein [Magnetovibrio sp.]|nr:ribbon-helix-helix domain-containing protein [Magnetovibrio sp.]